MNPSELFLKRTKKHYLYNIQPISNISSILRYGILCYDLADKIPHESIALNDVQQRRELVKVPNGKKLHQYANLYFTYNNPMLYMRKEQAEELCILVVSNKVLDIQDCILTDRNASTDLVKFYTPEDGINQIQFEKVFSQYWTHENAYEQNNHKAIKCAEVLIPKKIPYLYILGAYAVSETAKIKLLNEQFDRKIIVDPKVFYRKEVH